MRKLHNACIVASKTLARTRCTTRVRTSELLFWTPAAAGFCHRLDVHQVDLGRLVVHARPNGERAVRQPRVNAVQDGRVDGQISVAHRTVPIIEADRQLRLVVVEKPHTVWVRHVATCHELAATNRDGSQSRLPQGEDGYVLDERRVVLVDVHDLVDLLSLVADNERHHQRRKDAALQRQTKRTNRKPS